MRAPPYLRHLQSANDLVTTDAARRAFSATLRIERERRAEPYLLQANALRQAVSQARLANDLRAVPGIEGALLIAAGLPERELPRLKREEKSEAIETLITVGLEPAGEAFVEELTSRFLRTRREALDGSMHDAEGFLAQQRMIRGVVAALQIAGAKYRWQDTAGQWSSMSRSG